MQKKQMKYSGKKWFALWACLLGWTAFQSVVAQSLSTQMVLPVKDVQVHSFGSKLEVSFELELDTLSIPSNRFMRLIPALIKADSVCLLQPITVAGRRQYLMRERKETERMLVKREEGKPQTYTYIDRFPYEPWMNGAQLVLTQDVCGCGGLSQTQQRATLKTLCFSVPVYNIQPVLAFATPQVEIVKKRQESGQAFLDFPVNQVVIYPNYRNNQIELQKITHTIDLVKNDSNTRITHIHIHGYASPEGSFANNRRLAQGRAEALKQYVRQLYHFPDSIFSVESTPEDWDGLAQWVASSNIAHQAEVQKVLDSSLEADAKNSALQQIDKGSVYARLLKEVYPALRHSDYTVSYTVRAFCVEEAKQMLKKRPQLLSLDEMFAVASTYKPGSEDFNEVFDIAVRLFPENEVANLNAALVAIHTKEYKRAANYLKKAGSSVEAIHARGIFCMMMGEYEKAYTYLKEAEKNGLVQATENLKQLALKQENLEQIKNTVQPVH